MKNIFLISSIIIFIAVCLVFLFFKILPNKPVNQNNIIINENKEGITIISPKENEVISSPLKITGYVSGDGWSGFEGQVGTVELVFDVNGNAAGPSTVLRTTSDWTKLPTTFEAILDNFNPKGATSGYLYFHNENPSGDPTRAKTFVVPVKFK